MKSVFDNLATKYDEWFDKNEFIYLTELEALRKLVPANGKGLEVGVGTGRFAVPLNISVGIDPSFEMLKIAEERGVDIVSGEGENLPFKDNEFDYVLLMVTLCFVKNPQKVIRESKRVTKNGGKIVVGIIDKESDLGKFYQKKDTLFYTVAKFYTVKECIKLLKKNRFKNIVSYQTIFKLPGEINEIEQIKVGYGEGGFVVISGEK